MIREYTISVDTSTGVVRFVNPDGIVLFNGQDSIPSIVDFIQTRIASLQQRAFDAMRSDVESYQGENWSGD